MKLIPIMKTLRSFGYLVSLMKTFSRCRNLQRQIFGKIEMTGKITYDGKNMSANSVRIIEKINVGDESFPEFF